MVDRLESLEIAVDSSRITGPKALNVTVKISALQYCGPSMLSSSESEKCSESGNLLERYLIMALPNAD
ncbi:hypothetical protein Tcan_17676 [Toxocara canis]|uniref:Uncharacterized protein n=1 Tax=Toxocara canis TaxID=6265 RepID=A0A0B2V0C8_TOXCA|nr:hypothetical protein Tcan_17676 [Toxocara canis]